MKHACSYKSYNLFRKIIINIVEQTTEKFKRIVISPFKTNNFFSRPDRHKNFQITRSKCASRAFEPESFHVAKTRRIDSSNEKERGSYILAITSMHALTGSIFRLRSLDNAHPRGESFNKKTFKDNLEQQQSNVLNIRRGNRKVSRVQRRLATLRRDVCRLGLCAKGARRRAGEEKTE